MSATPSSRQPRDLVHTELTSLLGPGGPLEVAPASIADFFTDVVQRDIALEYRALTPNAPDEGKAVIVTAGPPGAGKSTALSRVTADHRRIDPDEIKDLLLARARRAGLLDARLSCGLADGSPVGIRELSGWVHRLSTDISDEVRLMSLATGENIVMEGTLFWHELPGRYTKELVDRDYESLLILDVEVPLSVATEQARQRWWAGRESGDALGGRFISDAAVASYFNAGPVSNCATTARTLLEEARDGGIDSSLMVVKRDASGTERGALIRDGVVSAYTGSTGLARSPSVPCLMCGRPLSSAKSIALGVGPSCIKAA